MAELIADREESAQLPLGPGARRLGADAAAEQRELLALLLEDRQEFSGFAKRGLLVRILELADLTAELFEGVRADDPFMLAMRLHGVGGDECSDLANAIRTERSIVRGSS
jgi:hypothetical protein